MIDYENYRHNVSRLPVTPAILRTASTKDGKYNEGPERNLLHDYWAIRTADETKVRDAERVISFDTAVGFRNIRLNAISLPHDALTKRIICAEAFNGNVTPRSVTAPEVERLAARYDWLVRWRLAKNIETNSQLTIEDFKQFKVEAGWTDILDLVPIEHRLDLLVADPNYKLPLYRHGSRFRMDWVQFANELGVNRFALGHSKKFRSLLADRLPSFLIRAEIAIEKLTLYVRGTEPGPSRPVEDLPLKMSMWFVLDRLSIKGLLPHDTLAFQPPQMPSTTNGGKRTTTLLPHDLMRILRAASKWVLVYSDFIFRCLNARAALPPRPRLKSPAPILALMNQLNPERPHGLPPLNFGNSATFPSTEGDLRLTRAIAFLFVSCAILIGALGGRRRNEVAYLQSGCLLAGPVPKLTIYIEKTLQDVDAIPVPTVVVKAIELLERLSAQARAVTREPWLFQFQANYVDGQVISADTRFGGQLKEFLEVNGLPPPAGAPVWDFSFHMLRKGFVTSYYHGNLSGSFDGANRMLRHSPSGDMTRIYMDDAETGAISWLRNEVVRLTKENIKNLSPDQLNYLKDAKAALQENDERRTLWNEGRQEFFVRKMMEVYDSHEHPIGKGAARMLTDLEEMENRAYARIRFGAVPTNEVSGIRHSVLEQVQKAAIDHFIEPVPGGFFYCLFKRGVKEHAELANCLKAREMARHPWQRSVEASIDTRPDYLFSGLNPCLSCELCACFDENQNALEEVALNIKADVSKAATPSLAESEQNYVDNIFDLIREAERAVDGKQRPR